jgi:hypothetical protein
MVCSARKNTRPPSPMTLPTTSSEQIRSASVSGAALSVSGFRTEIRIGVSANVVTSATNRRTWAGTLTLE